MIVIAIFSGTAWSFRLFPWFKEPPPLKKSTTHKGVPKPMVFKIASSRTFKSGNFGAPATLLHVWVVLPMVFKMASSGDFQN